MHRRPILRGLQQVDPLSPQLFVLVVDVLSRHIKRAFDHGILQRLHPRREFSAISLYADDVVLFCHPAHSDVVAVQGIFQLFGHAFGLRVNFAKSSAALLHCDIEEATPIIELLGCPIVELPLKYLGIPLTIRRPTTAQLQPLVDRIPRQLPAWKAGLMNKAGRLAFVKSVLRAIPIHQLLVYAPPKKILKLIERIQKVPMGWTCCRQRWPLPRELTPCLPPHYQWWP